MTGVIGSFKVFDIINVMTQGGPGTATTMLAFDVYRTGFVFYKMGYASAIAWVLMIIVAIITLIQWWGQRKIVVEYYGGCHGNSSPQKNYAGSTLGLPAKHQITSCTHPCHRVYLGGRLIDHRPFHLDDLDILQTRSGCLLFPDPMDPAGLHHPALRTGAGSWQPDQRLSLVCRSGGRYLNSFIVTFPGVLGPLITSTLAGYAFARLRFPGKRAIFLLYLGTMIIPEQVLMVPRFMIANWLGIYNTHWSLILPYLITAFGVFLIRQACLTIPQDLFDAAQIDGAGQMQRIMDRGGSFDWAAAFGAGVDSVHLALE